MKVPNYDQLLALAAAGVLSADGTVTDDARAREIAPALFAPSASRTESERVADALADERRLRGLDASQGRSSTAPDRAARDAELAKLPRLGPNATDEQKIARAIAQEKVIRSFDRE